MTSSNTTKLNQLLATLALLTILTTSVASQTTTDGSSTPIIVGTVNITDTSAPVRNRPDQTVASVVVAGPTGYNDPNQAPTLGSIVTVGPPQLPNIVGVIDTTDTVAPVRNRPVPVTRTLAATGSGKLFAIPAVNN